MITTLSRVRFIPIYKYFNDITQIITSRHVSGYKRKPFYPIPRRNEHPVLYYSLKERLAEKDEKLKNPDLYEKVNIGFASAKKLKESSQEKKKSIKKSVNSQEFRKQSRECKLLIDLDVAEEEWTIHDKCKQTHVKLLAENNLVFEHLFGKFAYFYPTVEININYDFDAETVSPVYFGNLLKPKETINTPNVTIESDPKDLWTVLLTNPDGNIYDNDAEIIHWFMGNIPGGKIKEGEEIVEYMRPIPFKGTGFHRYVFVLYKQQQKIDFGNYRIEKPSLNLKDRTFNTYDFYKKYQDALTPASLVWFQADWDSSLTPFFHNNLDMKEPQYEYEFPKAYITPQKWFPSKKPFNRYLDMHRDPKELQQMMLLKRLKQVHPFTGEIPRPPYPQASPLDRHMPIWMQNEIRGERDGSGKYRYMYRGDDRPFQYMEKPKTIFGWVKKYKM